MILNAVGGEYIDDFVRLREDAGLSEMVGHGLVNRELVRELGRRCPEQRIATVDQDATIIESRKQEAGSLASLRGRAGLSADVGGMGRDERGVGR